MKLKLGVVINRGSSEPRVALLRCMDALRVVFFFWGGGGGECKTLQALETMGPQKPTFFRGFYGKQPGF